MFSQKAVRRRHGACQGEERGVGVIERLKGLFGKKMSDDEAAQREEAGRRARDELDGAREGSRRLRDTLDAAQEMRGGRHRDPFH